MSLKQLAEELGLSLTTVSRALNGYPEVSPHTREMVREAAQRLHHQPNASARRLALGRAEAVGLVLPSSVKGLDASFLIVVAAMTERLAQVDLALLILMPAGDELAAYDRAVTGRRVDAFLVINTRVHDERMALLSERSVPFTAYGRSSMLQKPYAWVDSDHRAGAALAAARLLSFGHRRLGYVGASPQYQFASQRFRAFAQAIVGGGGELVEDAVVRNAAGPCAGYEAMEHLLALPKPPSAVLVDNGPAGEGALQAALDHGVQLGRDLSIVVYGDVEADNVVPTCVGGPCPENIGVALAEMTVALLAGQQIETLQRLHQPVLIAGTSDGPVAG